MPSVGMRRATRARGVLSDGARVLRSGRRLWPNARENKPNRGHESEDSYSFVKNPQKNHVNGYAYKKNSKKESHRMEVESRKEEKNVDRMFGKVYTRKRKRTEKAGREKSEDKKYGKRFSRRQRRKTRKDISKRGMGSGDKIVCPRFEGSNVLGLVVIDMGSCVRKQWVCSFLSLVLGYWKRASVRLPKLAAFLMSDPVGSIYRSNGVNFLWGPPKNGTGICKLFGARPFTPLFSVDFSAVPHCFMYIHRTMLLRRGLCFSTVNNSMSDDISSEDEEDLECMTSIKDTFKDEMKPVVSKHNNTGNKAVLHPSIRASKLAVRNTQYRNGLSSRGIQKRRSSMRRSKARNPSLGLHKASGALLSDLISSRRNGIPFSSVVSKNKLRSSMRSRSAAIKDVSSTMMNLTHDVETSCCTANILVIRTDRCCREVGAVVMLELLASGEWYLAVRIDGKTKYMHKPQKVMRPCSSNRVTHDIIWVGDENWKLEFPNRQDWLIFKDLYKDCFDRNLPAPGFKVIPVPGVHEVPDYEDEDGAPFQRPDSYISVNGDEVSRALAKRTANYDMDYEDEEWLKKFNAERLMRNEICWHVSEDSFELMIDAFEKAVYCSPDDYTDEEAVVTLCLDLGCREVVKAVYSHWLRKRKQKRAALLRVFQGHQGKKASLVPKPVLRKRRSLKRQASHGRGKQPGVLQAMAAEQDAWEEQTAMLKVEEAKVSANRSVESALLKRRRAQLLMENADMAAYKAMIALTIAEAARSAEASDCVAVHLIDE